MADNNETLHPGRILLSQAMEPLGISRNQLARDIDVPVGRISDITNGKRGVTADTALRLGRYFGTGPELWLRLQAEFDLYVARKTTWPAVESRVRVMTSEAPAKVQMPAAVPVEMPVAAPIDEMPPPEEAMAEHEPFVESGPEPVADMFSDEPEFHSEAGADSEIEPVDPVDEADNSNETEESIDAPVSIEPSPIITVDPNADSGAFNYGNDSGPATEPEEDLGIPPIPDRTTSFMSG